MNGYDDKQMITDVLSTQKHVADGYNSYANEAACEEVKNAFMSILNEEHEIGHQVFMTMFQRGWYPTEAADQNKVSQIKTKFASGSCG